MFDNAMKGPFTVDGLKKSAMAAQVRNICMR
jgi:hypothetical protein